MVEAQPAVANCLLSGSFETVSVSSVLQKNHREFGKKHVYDGKSETCWNSDQGLPQHIVVRFAEPQNVRRITMVSQGGFCPREIVFYLDDQEVQRFEAQDINLEQTFTVDESAPAAKSFKLQFLSSTDFYGRIIIYDLKLLKQK